MGSAKVVIKEQDRSAIVPSFNGIYAGITVVAEKGPVNQPILVTNENEFIDIFGEPNSKLGVAHYSAMAYLSQGNKLWVVRSAHEDAKHAGVLVRSKTSILPQGKTDSLTSENFIVNPIGGLTQDEVNAYSFPVYITNKLYEQAGGTIFEDVANSFEVRVNIFGDIKEGSNVSFTQSTLAELNSSIDNIGEDTPTYGVTQLKVEELVFDKITVLDAISGVIGAEVLKVNIDGSTESYPNNPTVIRDFTNSKTVLVTNADYISPDDTIKIGIITTTFVKKTVYKETANILVLDAEVTVTTADVIFEVVQSQFEDRDSFLVLATNQGEWGQDLSIAITPSKNYEDAFNIVVYFQGVQVEAWEVSRLHKLDGYKRQMFLEDKINGKSAYIKVIDNPNDADRDDVPEMPLFTDYSLWRQNPEDVFVDSTNLLAENLLGGHSEVKLNSVNLLDTGKRIKFEIDDNGVLSSEYKILTIDAVNNTLILDRPITEEDVPMEWIDNAGSTIATKVYYFEETNNNIEAGIIDGIRYFAINKLDNTFYNYPLNARFVISGIEGKLLDAGANMMLGGSKGTSVTVGDLIVGIKKLANKEETPVTLIMDGGFTIPAFAQAIDYVCEQQGLTHGYISCDPSAEDSANYKKAIVDYKAETMLNTHRCSFFTGWVKVYDEYNQKEVWVAPDGFACASQAFTTRNYQMWYPAAGWTRGKLRALDVKVKYSEGDRDYFIDNQINPIRYKKGSGLVIWGNETMLVKPSPMQLRSVAMLLIVIKYGLENMLEYKTFDLNNERTWSLVEGSINGFMRDAIQAKGGVYNYQVAIQAVITPSDIDNRRMPVFLGIQPTMDIKEIPVTLAIFNSGVDIDVSL